MKTIYSERAYGRTFFFKKEWLEHVAGVRFEQSGVGQDTVRCESCGRVLDIGLELREHVREHRALRGGE